MWFENALEFMNFLTAYFTDADPATEDNSVQAFIAATSSVRRMLRGWKQSRAEDFFP